MSVCSTIFARLGACIVAVALASCSGPQPVPPSTPPVRRCPSALTPLAPADADSVLFLRPHALFTDPQIGPIVARSFDDATETALIRRAERDGFDIRTIDRAVVATSPRSTVYFAAGPLDAARISDRLWERLLLPRHRTREDSFERVEGLLGRHLIGLLVDGRCGTAAYVEGRDTRTLDRLILPNDQHDPDALVVWQARHVPDAVAGSADTALVRQVREIDLRVSRATAGLTVNLVLAGSFTPDAMEHVRAALRAIIASPIGDLAGAVQWLDPDHAVRTTQPERIEVSTTVPWRAALALADALRGQTQVEVEPKKSATHNP